MTQFHSLTVSEVKKETPNSVSVTLDVPENLQSVFQFKAGQYITFKHISRDIEYRRAYSLCTPPSSRKLKVGIKKVKDGTFSVYANEHLKVGDTLDVAEPEGRFVFEPENNEVENMAAFAAGSGITPVLSIVYTFLEETSNGQFLLVYGNRNPEESMFMDEIKELTLRYPNRLIFEPVFSRSREDGALFGRIATPHVNFFLKNKYKDISFERFYLCGPETMIDTVSETLLAAGISEENILFELFTASEDDPDAPLPDGTTQLTIMLDDEEVTIQMSKEKTILDAALDEGIDAPYSCQGGICSSCIARVTSGSASMRKNQILTDSEVADGLILTCQAHPSSETLAIDYDDV